MVDELRKNRDGGGKKKEEKINGKISPPQHRQSNLQMSWQAIKQTVENALKRRHEESPTEK